jgi:hypothetical protein
MQLAIRGSFDGAAVEFLVLVVLGVPFVLLCSWILGLGREKPFVPR